EVVLRRKVGAVQVDEILRPVVTRIDAEDGLLADYWQVNSNRCPDAILENEVDLGMSRGPLGHESASRGHRQTRLDYQQLGRLIVARVDLNIQRHVGVDTAAVEEDINIKACLEGGFRPSKENG